ncbi:MAG TPA: alpha/beta hydrolase [Candidatus Binatia bacterium]|nr:alpha/beta hydrolase [Candidatus Binatia bacterium]
MEPHSQFILVDGINLHVADWGGSGRDLLLLHANGFLGWVYRAMLAPLVGRYHVRSMDFRGQGDSDKPPLAQCYWSSMARDVEEVIEQLGLRDFYGIGHSGGGALLALYAATHPGRAKKLALLEPVTIPHEPPFFARLSADNHPLVERTLRRRVVWDSREQLFAAYQGKDAFAAWDEEALRDYVNHGTYVLPDGRVALKCPAEVEAQVFATTMSLDIFSQIDKIDCPVLVLRGERTDAPLAVVAERAAQRIPHGSLITVPDTSHFLAMEKPQKVAEIICEYFRDG